MARNTQSNRGGNRTGSRSGSRSSRSNTNNPEGRNQYNSGFMDMARERPVAAAAAAAGAVAAGVFLWSKRSQISEQLTHISDQLGEWSENREFETVGADTSFSGSRGTGSTGDFIDSSGTTGSTARSGRTTSGSKRRGTGTTSSGGSTSGRTRP
jgi:hypothetical protein